MLDTTKLESVIKDTMIAICYRNIDNESEDIENDVDIAFTVIQLSFPEFECIEDTVTRRCAKSEIYQVYREAQEMRQKNGNYAGVLEMIEESITAESVMDDIIHMNTEDDEELV